MALLEPEFYFPLQPDDSIRSDVIPMSADGHLHGGPVPYWECPKSCDTCGQTIKEVNDTRKFSIDVDVSPFSPAELKMTCDHHKLSIHAEHGDRSFSRDWDIPYGIEQRQLYTCLTNDGVLHIEANKTQQPARIEYPRVASESNDDSDEPALNPQGC